MSQRAPIQLLRTDPTPPARRSMHPVNTFDLLPPLTNSTEFNKALFYQERCKQRAKCALSWRSSGISLGYTSPCNDAPLENDIKTNKTCNHVQSELSIYIKLSSFRFFKAFAAELCEGSKSVERGVGSGGTRLEHSVQKPEEKKLNSIVSTHGVVF